MAETSVRTTPGLMGYAAMSLLTAVFTWGVFFWYFAVRALILGGSCGARYGVACGPGTGWNILFVVVLTPAVCVAVSVLSNEIYGPERRGHEFFRVVLAALPVAALVDLLLYSQDFGFSAWRLVGAVPCLALIAVVTVWTIRTTGLRGAFWLMSPSRIVALGADPAMRGLSTLQNSMFLVSNGLGAVGGFSLARWVSQLVA
ncbi:MULTISPECIES: hypothetical protein [Streptomyces]|uniref:Sugar porter family MFS transporter n=1 Tax=Streptomyces anulatus TaxID=1892 RepID=A0ABZ1ZC84_STRAQ|nr:MULTISPECIES: hypothetical protein [Streptomyces]